jgi:predicted AAA+ superfamily ATPase
MKKKDQLKQIIRDFHVREDFDVKPRDVRLPIDSRKIITLIGVRRSGKTSILYDTINTLAKRIQKTKILFLNFEDERLELDSGELDLVLQAFSELYPEQDLRTCYFFFDEIQNIVGWEKFIRRIYDSISNNIFVTGSNSKLLSSEIATALRGRTLTFEIFPLSFGEYLSFLEIEVDLYASQSLAHIRNAQESYLKYGAFPELLFIDPRYRNATLQEYFNVLLYRDLVERYAITNTVALKFFLKRVIASSTKQISINKIYNDLKSSGIKIGKNTLYDFLEYAQNVYLALTLHRHDPSLVNKELGERKVYSIDIGLNNAVEYRFSDNIGKAMENAVFLQLRRHRLDLSYYRQAHGECDFLLQHRHRVTHALQVTYDMSHPDTRQREIKGLLNACRTFGLDHGTIVTYDTEDTAEIDGVTITVIPFYKWALQMPES